MATIDEIQSRVKGRETSAADAKVTEYKEFLWGDMYYINVVFSDWKSKKVFAWIPRDEPASITFLTVRMK